MKRLLHLCPLALFVFILFMTVAPIKAVVLLSNAPFPSNGGPCVGNFGGPIYVAAGFRTGGSATNLGAVSMVWGESSITNDIPITLALYSDNAGVPGSLLSTLGTQTTLSDNQTYTYSAGNFPLQANTTYWVLASTTALYSCAAGWGANPVAPSGLFTYVDGLLFYQGSWSSRGSLSLELTEGTAPSAGQNADSFDPGDDRINHAEVDRAAPVAIYCLPHGIQVRLIDSITGRGIDPPAIDLTYAEIDAAGIPSGSNLLLAGNDEVALYRLTTGEFQVNALDANALEYKWYVFVWDQCPVPTNSYHLEVTS